jgi:hypothetical protein
MSLGKKQLCYKIIFRHKFHLFTQIMSVDLLHKNEAYEIIGLCMEVHTFLGKGHSEVVYKDALQYEFYKNNIPFERERRFDIV